LLRSQIEDYPGAERLYQEDNPMKSIDLPVVKAESLNQDYFILWVQEQSLAAQTKAGQFFQLKVPDSQSLYKPISVYDVDKAFIGFFVKKLGKGTNALSQLRRGDLLSLIGPLGTEFPIQSKKKVVLISGGVGYPPMWYLRKQLAKQNDVYWLHGGNSKQDVFPCDEIWTVDGSLGSKGFVTQGLEAILKFNSFDVIYACGPEPMLKAVYQLANEYKVKLYVSMEAYMACGIGVCHGCVVPTGSSENIEYKKVCDDGAVFDANDICWSAL